LKTFQLTDTLSSSVYFEFSRFKDGSFLDDIWTAAGVQVSTGSNDSASGLKIHQSTKLSAALLGMGQGFGYEQKLEENEAVTTLHNMLMNIQDDETERAPQPKKPAYAFDDSDSEDEDDDEEEYMEKKVHAMKHGDLFRSDRGGAAIPCGAEGFEEEMGGATQDAYAVYENTKGDLGSDVETQSIGNVDNDDVSVASSRIVKNIQADEASMSVDETRGSERTMTNNVDQRSVSDVQAPILSSGIAAVDEPMKSDTMKRGEGANRGDALDLKAIAPYVVQSATISYRRNLAPLDYHSCYDSDKSQSITFCDLGNAEAMNPAEIPNIITNMEMTNERKMSPSARPRNRQNHNGNVQLVGLLDVETADTTFSLSDLQLPSYTKKKKKKKMKPI
jgi:hypothetical protein